MKTTNEIVDELTNNTAISLYSYYTGKEPITLVPASKEHAKSKIKFDIPLAELINLARAAKVLDNSSKNVDGSMRDLIEVEQTFTNALSALQAKLPEL